MNQRSRPIQRTDPPADLHLAEGAVHVWTASLQLAPDVLANLARPLSTSERERATKFKFDLHRNRFVAGRGLLRSILGHYLQADPAALDFDYSPHGKPSLNSTFGHAPIHFNLSHSEDRALVAITQAGPVGVDVERIRVIKNADDLVARFFSPRENELFQKLPPNEKPAAFFNLWTRKESLLKATGEGIAGGLDKVEVSFLPDELARLLAIAGDAECATAWTLHELSPAPGFAGAVAVRSRGVRLRFGEWK